MLMRSSTINGKIEPNKGMMDLSMITISHRNSKHSTKVLIFRAISMVKTSILN